MRQSGDEVAMKIPSLGQPGEGFFTLFFSNAGRHFPWKHSFHPLLSCNPVSTVIHFMSAHSTFSAYIAKQYILIFANDILLNTLEYP